MKKEPEGFWILPCDECRHFKKCKHYQDCIEDVKMGRALVHFEEKK